MSRGVRFGRRGLVAAAALIALPAALGTTTASAVPVSIDLDYTCSFPLMAPQPVELTITSDIPASVVLDTDLDPFAIQASAKVSAFATRGLRALEAVSIEGKANASAALVFPSGGRFNIKVPTTVEKTDIPASGEFTTAATGSTPSINLGEAGDTKITIGDLVLDLTPRLADGTLSGLDRFESECIQDPGQDNVFATINVQDDTADTVAPTKPAGLKAVSSQNSLALTWTPSTDNIGVTSYDVFQGGSKVATVTSPTATITGLSPNTSYSFTVQARDAANNVSTMSDSLTAKTTGSGTIAYGYNLTGSASIRTLSRGSVPLTGGINASLTLATGAFSADLMLNNSLGRLTALGFLPVTARIGFVPSGKTTGTLLDGVLKSTSLVRIKVLEVKLFGAIPLAGGNNCQTRKLSEINLQSTDEEFDPIRGGTIAGNFAISDLNGCGVLNGLVSPLTAGSGNLISLNLSPKTTV